MPENKLTDKNIRALKPTNIEQVIGDGGGLWVRVLPTDKGGAINFYYRYTASGKERRYNCGTYPKTTLAKARDLRNSARSLVKQGIDPVLKDEADRAQRKADQAMGSLEKTVRDLFDDWKRVYLSVHRKDGGEEVEQFMKYDVFPVIGNMKAKTVRLPHVVQVIDKIVERGARRKANLVLSLMRQMFRHGLARGIVETDPTLGLSKKQAGGKETPSNRNLSWEEIDELKAKLRQAGLHQRYQAATLLLLATGARVGELTHAKWDDIDQTENTWTIPASNSKNGRAHLIHLSEYALAQLATLRETKSGPYLLSGRAPDSHISEKTISKAIRDRIRMESLSNRTTKTGALLLTGGEWSPHDLRRTMASRMGDLGIAPHVIERCLNHVQQGIIGVYQRQEYLAERKAAYDTWGARLRIAGLTS